MAYATPRSMNARKKRSVCRQSTADNRTVCNSHVPYVIFSSIGGTMRDTQKLSICILFSIFPFPAGPGVGGAANSPSWPKRRGRYRELAQTWA